MSSGIESFSSSHQQVLNYLWNIEQEDSDVGILETTSLDSSNVATQLTTSLNVEPQSTLFVPFLGQSNAVHMSIVYDPYQPGSSSNETSGAMVLEQDLTSLSGDTVVTSNTQETNFAVGGSKVNGNGYYQDYNYVWWYPDQNQAGGALLQAEQGLTQWLSDRGARATDEIAIVWSQGESDVRDISSYNPTSREKYKQSTLAVFDYLKNNLGYLGYGNVTFYLVPTGRVQTEAAANSGLSSDAIASMEEGVAIIRDVQAEIALERDDVQLAPDYSDLNMVYEEGQIYGESYDRDYSSWSRDFWHLGHDGLKVNGSRLAQYIALDRGENNVISFTDSFGNPAQSVSISRAGLLDLNISESSQGLIQGTDNPDAIAGTLANDEITGGNGNDVIVASQGVDTLTGGAGSDVFFYDALVYPDLAAHQDRILDFAVGSDLLDISELLSLSGYDGLDPIADGYVVIETQSENSLTIQFDGDGRGEQPGNTIAILENVDLTSFQTEINDRFIFTPTEF